MRIDVKTAAERLLSFDNVSIITHAHPDGDTLGSAFSLARGLISLGKRAEVVCSDPMGSTFSFMWDNIAVFDDFKADHIVAVDIAVPELFGKKYEGVKDRVELCIDHHSSNTFYAKETLLDSGAAATAEIIYSLLLLMGVTIDKNIADCIYTALSTDTGGFRFSNTTSRTHRIAADLMDFGADAASINRAVFETKSRAYLKLESMALSTLEFFHDGKVAMMSVTNDMFRETGTSELDCEGLSSLPRQIEGVAVGATLRQKSDGGFKASVRTNKPVNACEICKFEGGGGHYCAAGCTFNCSLQEAKSRLLGHIEKVLYETEKINSGSLE